jgi:hypothetical protein
MDVETHVFLTSELVGGEWLTPQPLYFQAKRLRSHSIGDWAVTYSILQLTLRSHRVGQFKLFSNNCVHVLEIDHSS